MKRLLILVLSLLLCFAVSCKKSAVTEKDVEKDTPEVTEPVEKPEVTEPVETPTEIPEENVIVLPEPDENTVVIEIAFPEDFPEEPYQEPNLVSPEEFEWGEYVPFVRFNDFYYSSISSNEEDNYAILSDFSYTLETGSKLYDKINEMFMEEYEGEKVKTSFSGIDDNGRYNDFLYKSRIVYIASELDFVGRVRLSPSKKSWFYWNGQYDIISNDELLKNFYDKDLEEKQMTLGSKRWYYYCDPIYEYNNKLFGSLYSSDEKYWSQYYEGRFISLPVFYNRNEITTDGITAITKTYQFFSVEHNAIKYRIVLTDEYGKEKLYLTEFYPHEGDKQIVTLSKANVFNDNITSFTKNCYMLDLNSKELTYLESYTFQPSISPDGKYLLYVNHNDGEYPFNMKPGIYIKNLEDNTTVYYETSGFYNTHGIIEWVNEKKLLELIK